MEFLITSNANSKNFNPLQSFNKNRISYRKATEIRSKKNAILATNGREISLNDRSIFFYGSAFIGNGLINNYSDLSIADWLKYLTMLEEDLRDAAGTFALIRCSSLHDRIEIDFDHLNASPCFYATIGDKFAVSNNIHMVADWMVLHGVTPERSIEPFMSDASFSSSLLGDTLYKQIATVQPQERLVINGALKVERVPSVVRALLDHSYSELIEACASRIAHRVAVLNEMSARNHCVIDVTGGMDSRILLAALSREGNLENWCYNTLFDHPNPDGNFAKFIGQKLGLRRMRLHWADRRQLHDMHQARLDLFHSMGSENKRGFHPFKYQPSLVRVHGGYGELGGKSPDAKRFYKKIGDRENLSDVLRTYMDTVSDYTMFVGFGDKIASWARAKLTQSVEGILGDGLPLRAVPAVFYGRNRARSHFGYVSHLRSLRCQYPDVLNDPYLIAAAVKIGPALSLLGKVNFDLIKTLGGDDIATLPLAKARWAPALFGTKDQVKTYSRPPINERSDAMFSKAAEVSPPPPGMEAQVDFPETYYRTHKKHAARTIPRRATIETNILMLRELLQEGAFSDEVLEFVPRSRIEDLAAQNIDEIEPTTQVLSILKFVNSAEMWMRKLELRYPYA